MAVGDKVKIGNGHLFEGTTNIPIYHVDVDSTNKYVVDSDGCSIPKFIGGVKPGSIGFIDGNPTRAVKSKLAGYDKVPALGQDYVNLYPIRFEYYKQVAWVPCDFFQIIY
jgi:hypothetical protein